MKYIGAGALLFLAANSAAFPHLSYFDSGPPMKARVLWYSGAVLCVAGAVKVLSG